MSNIWFKNKNTVNNLLCYYAYERNINGVQDALALGADNFMEAREMLLVGCMQMQSYVNYFEICNMIKSAEVALKTKDLPEDSFIKFLLEDN